MKFGYFDDLRREYVITNPKTPVKWINYVGGLGFGGLDRLAQLLGHRVGDGVAPVRIVDGDQRDAIDDLVKNQVRHSESPSWGG